MRVGDKVRLPITGPTMAGLEAKKHIGEIVEINWAHRWYRVEFTLKQKYTDKTAKVSECYKF